MIYALLIAFQIKHYLADYIWQTEYMLGKFKSDWSFFLPLLSHSLVHAVFTFVIVYLATLNVKLAVSMGLLDLSIHFTMDRIKASPRLLGRFESLTKKDFVEYFQQMKKYEEFPDFAEITKKEFDKRKKSNTMFWRSLGIDQMVHHLTHYVIIYLTLRG